MRTLFSIIFAISFTAYYVSTIASPVESNYIGELFTNDYFNVTDKPVLGNGHIAYIPFNDSIYMNGLYNGINDNTHRARIPNYANIYFDRCGSFTFDLNKLQCIYALNMQQAVFYTKADFENGTISIEHIQFVHRYYESVIVNKFVLQRIDANSHGMCECLFILKLH